MAVFNCSSDHTQLGDSPARQPVSCPLRWDLPELEQGAHGVRACLQGNQNPFLSLSRSWGLSGACSPAHFQWAASKEQLGGSSMLRQQKPSLPCPELPKLGHRWMARVRRDRCVLSDLLKAIASHPASPGCFLGIIHFLSQVAGLTDRYSSDICNHRVWGKKW